MSNPFDPESAVLKNWSETNSLRHAAGLGTLSATLSSDLYSELTGGSIAERFRQQELGALSSLKHDLLQSAKSAFGIADEFERMNKSRADMLLGEHEKLRGVRSSIADAMGPLSAMRSVALYEDEIEKFKKYLGSPLGYLNHADYLEKTSPTAQIRKHYEHLLTNVGETLTGRWIESTKELARSFSQIGALADKPQDLWNNAQNLSPAHLARDFGVPTMDSASLAAIARLSGTQGLFDQLKGFGVDAQMLRALASSVTEDEEELDDLVGKFDGEESKPIFGLTMAQVAIIWAIVFTLYQVFFPMYQQWDSNQAEARITQRIEASEQRSEQRFEAALAQMLACTMEAAERMTVDTVSMVVRHRVTLIRRKADSGAGVVAEVFPNQVVTLVSDEGKWIRVKYFDWLAGEEREGWSLKKYYARVERKSPNPLQNCLPKSNQAE